MALVIELRSDGKVVGGMNEWWDWIEHWVWSVPSSAERFPVLRAIDPYDDRVVSSDGLPALTAELEDLLVDAPRRVALDASRLLELCRRAAELPGAYLNFLGD